MTTIPVVPSVVKLMNCLPSFTASSVFYCFFCLPSERQSRVTFSPRCARSQGGRPSPAVSWFYFRNKSNSRQALAPPTRISPPPATEQEHQQNNNQYGRHFSPSPSIAVQMEDQRRMYTNGRQEPDAPASGYVHFLPSISKKCCVGAGRTPLTTPSHTAQALAAFGSIPGPPAGGSRDRAETREPAAPGRPSRCGRFHPPAPMW